MEKDYAALREWAVRLENMFRGMLDSPDHHVARALRDEFRDLIVDIRTNKLPRNLEQRIQGIQRYLMDVRDEAEVMAVGENVQLHDDCERFRRRLRELPNYQS